MSRRRELAEHALIFLTALLTLPLAAGVANTAGPFLAGLVLVGGLWIAIASTLRLRSVTSLFPTIAAMGLSCCATVFLALSAPGPTCSDGRSGFMDGCAPPAETVAAWVVLGFVVLTGVLCAIQLLVTPSADAIRRRLPPSARLPMEDRAAAASDEQ